MRNVFLLSLLILLFHAACSTQRLIELEGPARFTTEKQALEVDPVVIKPILQALPDVVDEDFQSFLSRVRAACLAQDDPLFHRISSEIPETVDVELSPLMRGLFPFFIAKWARGFHYKGRYDMLRRGVSYQTESARSGQVRASHRSAFSAFEADIKKSANDFNLSFSHVDNLIYSIELDGTDSNVDGGSDNVAPLDIGLLSHVDVRKPDTAIWGRDPYTALETEQKLIGHGVYSNKGALVAAFFALAALRASEIQWKPSFALLIGTAGTTNQAGLRALQKRSPLPEQLFLLDGEFPLVTGELGQATMQIETGGVIPSMATAHAAQTQLVGLIGGESLDRVAAMASAWIRPLRNEDPLPIFNTLEQAAAQSPQSILVSLEQNGEIRIDARGQNAPASQPAQGDNAILHLFSFLATNAGMMRTPCSGLIHILDATLTQSGDASRFNFAGSHPAFSPPSLVPTTVTMNKLRGCKASLDVRWPPPRDVSDIIVSVRQLLQQKAASEDFGPFELTITGSGKKPFYISTTDGLVSNLQASFSAVFGQEAAPRTISESNYGKVLGDAPLFGSRGLPGAPSEADRNAFEEYLMKTEFDSLVEVYTFALARLGM